MVVARSNTSRTVLVTTALINVRRDGMEVKSPPFGPFLVVIHRGPVWTVWLVTVPKERAQFVLMQDTSHLSFSTD